MELLEDIKTVEINNQNVHFDVSIHIWHHDTYPSYISERVGNIPIQMFKLSVHTGRVVYFFPDKHLHYNKRKYINYLCTFHYSLRNTNREQTE